jgi:hypothetical protein
LRLSALVKGRMNSGGLKHGRRGNDKNTW